jgi:hypothetical protein
MIADENLNRAESLFSLSDRHGAAFRCAKISDYVLQA